MEEPIQEGPQLPDYLIEALQASPPDASGVPDVWREPRPVAPQSPPGPGNDAFLDRLMAGAIPIDQLAARLPPPPAQSQAPAMPARFSLPPGANVGSYEVSEKQYSPDQLAMREALDAEGAQLSGQRARTAEELGDVTSEGLAEQAELARDKSVEAALQSMEFDEALDEAEERMARAKSEQDAAHEAYRKFEFRDYWSTRSTGQKVLALISVALGSFASAMLGRKNEALDIINGNIERDFHEQEKQLAKLGAEAKMAATGMADVDKANEAMLTHLKLKNAAAYGAVAAKMEEAALRSRSEQVRLQAQQAAQEMRAKELKLKLDAIGPAGRTIKMEVAKRSAPVGIAGGGLVPLYDSEGNVVPDASGRPRMVPKNAKYLPREAPEAKATEAQNKLALMADDIKNAVATIEAAPPMSQAAAKKLQRQEEAFMGVTKLSSQGAFGNMAARFQRWTGLAPSSKYEGLSEQDQLAAHAYDVAKDAYLRIISGAGITDPEDMRNAMSNKPQYGDGPKLIAQKLERLKRIAANALKLSGPAGAMVAPTKASASPGPGWVYGSRRDGTPGWRDPKTGEFRPD